MKPEIHITCYNHKQTIIDLVGDGDLQICPRIGECVVDIHGNSYRVKDVIHYNTAYSHEISVMCDQEGGRFVTKVPAKDKRNETDN